MAMTETEPAEEEGAGKKKTLVLTVAAVAAMTLVAAGGGWFVGTALLPQTMLSEEESAADAGDGKGEDKEGDKAGFVFPDAGRIVTLDPLTTNLSHPAGTWVRLEVSLIYRDEPDRETTDMINEDMLAYLRTVSLQQIAGPRGFLHLREDLLERAILRSQGRVSDLIFRTFAIE